MFFEYILADDIVDTDVSAFELLASLMSQPS